MVDMCVTIEWPSTKPWPFSIKHTSLYTYHPSITNKDHFIWIYLITCRLETTPSFLNGVTTFCGLYTGSAKGQSWQVYGCWLTNVATSHSLHLISGTTHSAPYVYVNMGIWEYSRMFRASCDYSSVLLLALCPVVGPLSCCWTIPLSCCCHIPYLVVR